MISTNKIDVNNREKKSILTYLKAQFLNVDPIFGAVILEAGPEGLK
jgi:hypothetical protein